MKFAQKAKLLFFKNNWNEYISRFLSGEDVGNSPNSIAINQQTAMKYSAVFACVKVLSETHACMPIMLYRTKKDGDRERITNSNIYDVLHNAPNEEMSPFSFKEALMTSLCLGGNAFAQKLKNIRGEVVGLNPIDWQNVTIDRDKETQRLVYKISGTKDNLENIPLTRDDIFHIPGLSLNGINGLSPISYESEAIKLGLSYQKFGVKFYENGATPSGVVEIPSEMRDDAFQRFKGDFKKNYAGMVNAGTPMILEGGTKYTPLAMKQTDAQFLESRRFQTEEIARIYRVPLHLIQDLTRSTNNNIEQQSLEFVIYTMLPWVKRWEEAINQQLLTANDRKSGYYVEFSIANLLRGDIKSRSEAYSIGRLNGWLSINDIRRLENMNAVEGGNEYMQPLNYINIKLADDYYTRETQKQKDQTPKLAEQLQNMIEGK